jgi:glutathione synthase/RimK-type ligase-like ATP-grasp enzyme
MRNLIVVEDEDDWTLDIPGIERVLAKEYLTEERFKPPGNIKVYNLCKNYRYQSVGYYVSLLAIARGHKPIPSINTIQDIKSHSIVRIASENLDDLLQRILKPIRSDDFTLSIYFGKNLSAKYDQLAKEISRAFNAPMLRAFFKKSGDKWHLSKVIPIGLKDVSPGHMDFFRMAAEEHFKKRQSNLKMKRPRFNVAILINPEEKLPPSCPTAIKKFIKAAEKLDIEAELITKNDIARLGEYDGLFIRETTAVNHHTFRAAQKASALGMCVIDDPDSILKCTNKVYLSDLLNRYHLPSPATRIVDRNNIMDLAATMKFPCILKQPDSSFSQGVIKVENSREFIHNCEKMMDMSELVLAQEFVPTTFDWRIGVLDGKPLFVCKYYMAKDHWQIYKREPGGKVINGRADSIPIDQAPEKLLNLAVKATKIIGDGLYGVDIKQFEDKYSIIEINDNPSIDNCVEDIVLKDKLYETIMKVFLDRMMQKVEGRAQ